MKLNTTKQPEVLKPRNLMPLNINETTLTEKPGQTVYILILIVSFWRFCNLINLWQNNFIQFFGPLRSFFVSQKVLIFMEYMINLLVFCFKKG